MAEVTGLKDAIQQGEQKQRDLEAELKNQLAVIPNIPADDVPQGADENANVPVEARHYKATRSAAGGMNNPKEHFELGEALKMMDFERAAKVSGARFVYLKGQLARLNRALASRSARHAHDGFGYEEVGRRSDGARLAMFGTGSCRNSRNEVPGVQGGRKGQPLLARRAEVPLTNYSSAHENKAEPSPCASPRFTPLLPRRSGPVPRGRTRGMIRMHQFDKVELVSSPRPKNRTRARAYDRRAQEMLRRLDMRTASSPCAPVTWLFRPQDLRHRGLAPRPEPLPRNRHQHHGDFQARRMNTRYRGATAR